MFTRVLAHAWGRRRDTTRVHCFPQTTEAMFPRASLKHLGIQHTFLRHCEAQSWSKCVEPALMALSLRRVGQPHTRPCDVAVVRTGAEQRPSTP